MVTVAVRRMNITDRKSPNLLDYLDPKKYKILPNTPDVIMLRTRSDIPVLRERQECPT